jgi:hypothetical protein
MRRGEIEHGALTLVADEDSEGGEIFIKGS